MKSSRVLLLLIIIGAVVAVPIVQRNWAGSGAVAVETDQVTMRVIRPSILASGQLAHEDEVNLTSEIIGKVERLHVEEGQAVAAGELVLEIDAEAFATQVEQRQAAVRIQEIDIERKALRISNLERQHARRVGLFEKKLLDDTSFDTSENEVALARVDLKSSRELLVQARAALAQAQEQLDKTQVRAPITGVVTSLDIEVGETAITSSTNIPGSGLMTIADPSTIMTEVFVDEADVADIGVGQPARIVAIAHPDEPLDGVVASIANTAKLQPGRQGLSFLVRIRINDDNGIKLRPGMTCRSEIYTQGEDDVLAVPIQAVITKEDPETRAQEHFVFVVKNGTAHKTAITTGIADDELQEITSGVDRNAMIVVGPSRVLRNLRDGQEVTGGAS